MNLYDALIGMFLGTGGEHTETKDGIYDISNKQRLGLTEDEAVKTMVRGVDILVYMEKRLGEETEGTIRWLYNAASFPGGHCWHYHPGTLSLD